MRVTHIAPTAFGSTGCSAAENVTPLGAAGDLAREPGVECKLVTVRR